LPKTVETRHGQYRVTAYPALVDKGESVAIEILDTVEAAALKHQQGVLRLLMLKVKDQVKYLRKNLPGFQRMALLYVTRGEKDALLGDLVEAIFRYTFIEGQPEVRDKAAFDVRLRLRADLVEKANDICDLLLQALEQAHEIGKQLEDLGKQPGAGAYQAVVADIRQQLDNLIGPGFLAQTPLEWLQQYPRYMKAIVYRLDKLQGTLAKQAPAMADLQACWQQYNERSGQKDGQNTEVLRQYRWMLEEYRVSLFAQPLGTRVPVSAKRLKKLWADCL